MRFIREGVGDVVAVMRASSNDETINERLDPRYAYLRIGIGKRFTFLVLHYVDPSEHGPIEIWYGAGGDVLLRQNGRMDMQSSINGDPAQCWQASRVATLIEGFPVTGSVRLKNADPRWLQGNPSSELILAPSDAVPLADGPKAVTVVRTTGSLCGIPYHVNAEARHYVESCDTHETAAKAWIGQPDGTVISAGIARWNSEA